MPTPQQQNRDATATSHVLIVEDDSTAALLLETIVNQMGHATICVGAGRQVEDMVAAHRFDLILLDLGLPDLDGIEVARRLRRRWPEDSLPIVFVSGDQDPHARVEGFGVGGADFITKPYHVPEVRARVHHQLEARRLKRELRTAAEVLEERVRDRTAELSLRMSELGHEVERRRALEEDLRRLAATDPVTGLLNQRGLPAHLDTWRSTHEHGLVVAIEVEGWESVTGVLGHQSADRLLRAVADRIADADPDAPTGRLGASLFVTALGQVRGDVFSRIAALSRVLEDSIRVDQRSVRLTFRIGAVHDSDPDAPADDLLRDATLALHAAKHQSGGTVVLDSDRRSALSNDLHLEQELWGAAARGELALEYQPVFAVETLERTGFEALIRWIHPLRGRVSPGCFIPLAERSGAITEIGAWSLFEATRQLADWRRRSVVDAHATVAVNLSAVEVIDLGLPARVSTALEHAALDPDGLLLELTETAVLEQGPAVEQVLGALRDEGIRLCLDDFGTGSSSLTVLRQVPADIVKIDRSFVREIVDDERSRAIVESTVALAHRLGKRVVVEGVETMAQFDLVRTMACDEVQGYLLGRPVDPRHIDDPGEAADDTDQPTARSPHVREETPSLTG